MRFAVPVLSLISCAPLSLALADPPSSPAAAPPSTPIVAPAATPAAPEKAATAANPSSAEQSPATPAPAAAPTAAAADEAKVEKDFLAKGYSVQMINGEKNFCRRERPIGSRLLGPPQCMTAAEAQAIEADSRNNVEKMQRSMGCMNFGKTANCGN